MISSQTSAMVSRKISRKASLVPSRFDAVAFDLDGVITDTARIHFQAWQQTFDALFEGHTRRTGATFAPFTLEDYHSYIDGRPREDAIRAFLSARVVGIEDGSEADGPEAETVHGLAKRKDGLFLERMRSKGVDVYPSTVALIRRLRALGLRTAVVSASRNCREVLQAARLPLGRLFWGREAWRRRICTTVFRKYGASPSIDLDEPEGIRVVAVARLSTVAVLNQRALSFGVVVDVGDEGSCSWRAA